MPLTSTAFCQQLLATTPLGSENLHCYVQPDIEELSNSTPAISVFQSGGFNDLASPPSLSANPTVELKTPISWNQIADRHSIIKELQVFSGDPQDWLLFLANYERTTQLRGFCSEENFIRLYNELLCARHQRLYGLCFSILTVVHESCPRWGCYFGSRSLS